MSETKRTAREGLSPKDPRATPANVAITPPCREFLHYGQCDCPSVHDDVEEVDSLNQAGYNTVDIATIP